MAPSAAPPARPTRRARRRLGVAAAAALAWACVPSAGPFRLAAAHGRVVDAESGAPVAGAEVIEWYRGAGAFAGPQPVYHARWATSDSDGRFAFGATCAPSPRMWLLKTYGPDYSVYHPRYGLQHGARREGDSLVLAASLARAEQARADLAPICRGERDDPGARHLAGLACPPSAPRRPSR
jgi:hypothetical protein